VKTASGESASGEEGCLSPERPAFMVAVKHNSPCGAALGTDAADAYRRCHASDPVSIFGGVVACNVAVDEEAALAMAETFLEVMAAPGFSPEALAVLGAKKNLRVIALRPLRQAQGPAPVGEPAEPQGPVAEPNTPVAERSRSTDPPVPSVAERSRSIEPPERVSVSGGMLEQTPDDRLFEKWEVVTEGVPTEGEERDMRFGMVVAKHAKSNAVVVVRDGQALGIGAGQTNRIWAAEQALERASAKPGGAGSPLVLVSDGFFPFRDCVDAAATYGVAAILQPGGSIRDGESIAACNEHHIAMVFSGTRHFRH
jgi:phosphoribosylaminoimidazolecarboxamide formyltransferase/IMP cyclohydrolase